MESEKFTKHLIYWILPLVLMLSFVFVYFYDIYGLAKLIAPRSNREFGLIENLQLLLIVGIFIIALSGLRNKKTKPEKYGYTLLFMAAAFCFLEEIDYGLHYYEYFAGKTREQVEYQILVEHQVRNIHNIAKMNSIIKFQVYLCTILFFVMLPLLPKRILQKYRWLRYFAPSKYIVGTAVVLLFVNQTAQYLNTIFYEHNIALAGNTSEFEEVMNYYIFLLYSKEMVRKTLPAPAMKWSAAYFCRLRTKSRA
jgi:hypothetical protein